MALDVKFGDDEDDVHAVYPDEGHVFQTRVKVAAPLTCYVVGYEFADGEVM